MGRLPISIDQSDQVAANVASNVDGWSAQAVLEEKYAKAKLAVAPSQDSLAYREQYAHANPVGATRRSQPFLRESQEGVRAPSARRGRWVRRPPLQLPDPPAVSARRRLMSLRRRSSIINCMRCRKSMSGDSTGTSCFRRRSGGRRDYPSWRGRRCECARCLCACAALAGPDAVPAIL